MHVNNIIYVDVKPDNFMVDAERENKVSVSISFPRHVATLHNLSNFILLHTSRSIVWISVFLTAM